MSLELLRRAGALYYTSSLVASGDATVAGAQEMLLPGQRYHASQQREPPSMHYGDGNGRNGRGLQLLLLEMLKRSRYFRHL